MCTVTTESLSASARIVANCASVFDTAVFISAVDVPQHVAPSTSCTGPKMYRVETNPRA